MLQWISSFLKDRNTTLKLVDFTSSQLSVKFEEHPPIVTSKHSTRSNGEQKYRPQFTQQYLMLQNTSLSTFVRTSLSDLKYSWDLKAICPCQLLSKIPWNTLWFLSHLAIPPGLSESKNNTKGCYIVSNGRFYMERQHQWPEAQIHFPSSPPVLILRFGMVCIKWETWIQRKRRPHINLN